MVFLVKSKIVIQFNNGVCERCRRELVESPYIGGDHDPIAECSNCGKHYGCWECDAEAS
jgi:hypothetical protein